MIDLLHNILIDLDAHKGKDKESIWKDCVVSRLDTSMKNYLSDLETSYEYLERRRELNLIKKMNSYDKKNSG
jgi:hypothetical protein